MRMIVFLMIIFLVVSISGCTDEEIGREILSGIPVIGWFSGAASNSNQKTNSITTAPEDSSKDINDTKLASKLPAIPKDNRCPGAHQIWNLYYNSCTCESDYYMQNGVCVAKSSRQCTLDRDCSPDGQLSRCIDKYSKRMYYCDLNTYTCVNGKGVGVAVDCRSEYGSKYYCSNGNCVSS